MKRESYFSNCLYFSTSALARSLTRLADESFAPSGMAPSYAFVLMSVNRKPGISPTEIAKELEMKPSTITRFLDKLQQKAFLTREVEGKSVRVYPTSKSQAIDDVLQECWEELFEHYYEIFGDELSDRLTKNLLEANQRID